MLLKNYKIFGIVGYGEIGKKAHGMAINLMGELYAKTNNDKGFKKLIESEDINVISICSPNYKHVDQAIEALDADKRVILEKPIATNLEDANRLLAHPLSDTIAVCYQRRYNKECQQIKQIPRNKIERIVASINVRRGPEYWNTWRSDKKKSGGGALINIGIHYLDLLQWWLGDKYTVEFAQIAKLNHHSIDGVIISNLDFDGIPVSFNVNAINDKKDIKMEVFLKDGTVKIYTEDDATHFDIYNRFLNHDDFITPREAYKSLEMVMEIYRKAEDR